MVGAAVRFEDVSQSCLFADNAHHHNAGLATGLTPIASDPDSACITFRRTGGTFHPCWTGMLRTDVDLIAMSTRTTYQSKALAIFFAHAKLATPPLDRTTVEALLDGRMTWPRADSEPPQPAIQFPLALLEEHGLVSFIAGWCVVHCQSVRNVEVVDPSLRPLIQAVEFLNVIRDGSDGYYPPHFTLPVGELEARLLPLAGISPIAELLPQLRVEDGNFVSTPGNQNFDALVCTYLWQVLLEVLAPRQAFERWLWCLRTHCRWAMPVIWEQLGNAEHREFADQLVAHLADDVSLHGSMTTLLKQAWNEHSFSSLITPVQITMHVSIGSEERAKEKQHEVTPRERLTLATLNTAYPVFPEDHSDALQFVCLGQRFKHWRTVDGFYSWLIASSIEVSVGIDGQQLFSWELPNPYWISLRRAQP